MHYKLAFDINQSYFKAQFNYYLSSKHVTGIRIEFAVL